MGPVTLPLLLSIPSIVKLLLRGRWPPTEGPLPAPTEPLVATPDCKSDKFSTPDTGFGRVREIGNLFATEGCLDLCRGCVNRYGGFTHLNTLGLLTDS